MNHRTAWIWFIGCLVLLAQGSEAEVLLLSSTPQSVQLEFRLSDLRMEYVSQEGGDRLRLAFDDSAYTTEEGRPRLPVQSVLIGIPPTGDVTIRVLDTQDRQLAAGRIELVPKRTLARNQDGDLIAGLEPAPEQPLPPLYPERVARLGETGFIRDQRVCAVQFLPVQYRSGQHDLQIHDRIRVALDFSSVQAAPALGSNRPESPTYERILQKELINYSSAKQWRRAARTEARLAPALAPLSSQGALKIGLVREGMYRLGYDVLKDAGVPLKGLDPRTIKMFYQGQQIPIFVRGEYDKRFDPRDEVIFYGKRLKGSETYYDPFTFENVYWLSWGGQAGRRMVKRSLDVPADETRRYSKFRFLVHAEEELAFTRLGEVNDITGGSGYIPIRGGVFQRQAGGGLKLPPLPPDSWFWDSIPHSSVREYPILLPGVAETSLSVAVRVMLHGLTSHPTSPDHHTILWINGVRQLHDEMWDGQTPYYYETTELSQDFLHPGENKLIVMSPGDTEAQDVDQVLFNWFEIEYWRSFEAEDNLLEFSIPATTPQPFSVVLSGFTSPEIEIFGVDGSLYVDNLVLEDERNPGTYLLRFISQPEVREPQDSTVQYISLTRDRFLEPEWLKMDTPSDLRSPLNGADYLVIAHESLAGGVQPLIEWREEQGLRTKLVTTQNIYDEFSGGIFQPTAIRDFLKYAYENWQSPAPTYVLLVGDANLHYRTDVNYVPTLQVQTPKYGAAASDNQFVTIRGDDAFPDMSIGRIPVRNQVDLNTVVQKILDYERTPQLGPWRHEFLFLGGAGRQFVEQTEEIIEEYVPEEYRVLKVIASDPDAENYGGAREVIEHFNNGPVLINFIGHGGGSIWSDNRMLGLEDIPLLQNGKRLPFVVSMTCFTGYFDNPNSSCLGEEMLKAPDGGAVAFFGNTGLGWLLGDFYLTRKFYGHLFRDNVQTLGDLVSLAKSSFLAEYPDYVDLVEMFTLLGDPALRLGLPEGKVTLGTVPVVERNALLPVSGQVTPSIEGELELEAVDGRGQVLDAVQVPITGGQFQARLSIGGVAESGGGVIRGYAWSDSQDAVGMATYAIDTPYIADLLLEPAPVSPDIQPTLSASIVSAGGIAEVQLRWSLDRFDWQAIPMTPGGANRYQTIEPLPEHSAGTMVYYYVAVTDTQGTEGQGATESYRVLNYPDLLFAGDPIARRASVPQALVACIKNRGELPAEEVTVRFFEGDPAEGRQIDADVVVPRVPPGEEREAVLLWQPAVDATEEGIEIYAVIDPDAAIREFNESNNRATGTFFADRFAVTVQQGSNGPVSSLDGRLSVEIPSGGVIQDGVLRIEQLEGMPVAGQPDLYYVDAQPVNYRLSFISEKRDTGPLQGNVSFDASHLVAAAPNLGIYYDDEEYRHWVRISNALDPKGRLAGTLSGTGVYALMLSTDQQPPEVSITVEHQGFIDGSYVSSTPVISAVITDANGIDMRQERMNLLLDQREVPPNEYDFEASGNQAFLSFAPTLSDGRHSVLLQVSDASGNEASAEANLEVASELTVDQVANFPNPFAPGRKERRLGTTFAYVLTAEADQVTLKVYTVTGRLVRELKGLDTSPDYNEFHWDGFDSDGEELPNGVYLYQFIAERARKRAKKAGVLAILR